MSVAFRRESDEEHKEPRFEIPIPAGPNLVTVNGLALIERRVAELESAVASITDPVELESVRRDLRYWHTRRMTAQLAPPAPSDQVAFGSRVRIRQGKSTRTIEIVGTDEADPAAGSVAFDAPLARALIGTEAGEDVAFGPGGTTIRVIELLQEAASGTPG